MILSLYCIFNLKIPIYYIIVNILGLTHAIQWSAEY